jgi:predicted signal transduction protein with EAL and GGDEF domain
VHAFHIDHKTIGVERAMHLSLDTFEQVTHLRELGVRSAQGYVFAPPLPGSAFLQLVEAIDPLPLAAPAEGAGQASAA